MDFQLQSLIDAGAADAVRCLGSQAALYRSGEAYWEGSLVWVETGGSYSVELGGAVYAVTGRAALRCGAVPAAPQPGDRLRVNGRVHLVVGVFMSPYDKVYNIEATLLPR